jgi:hypothetical protein
MRLSASMGFCLVFALALTGCGGPASTSSVAPSRPSQPVATTSPPAPSTTAPSASAASDLVGEWVGTHECDQIVAMLNEAGLQEFALESLWGNGLLPGVDTEAEIEDPDQPCTGAVPREHSHYFTEDGRFGSRDFDGNQVDDGAYEIVEPGVVEINGSRFGYVVEGDTLTLEPEPVDVSACATKECRFRAAWVLMVALPGSTWMRNHTGG